MKGTKPFPFQREIVDQMKGRDLLALEMGLGKTFTALLRAKECPDVRPVVAVCPASVKFVWEREAWVRCGLRAAVLEGRKPERGIGKFPLYIVNYDILGDWLEWLKNLNPQMVIGDEIQAIKNKGAQRSKAFRKLCQGVPSLVFLSGTPLISRPAELFNAANLLWPKEFSSFFSYAKEFCAPKRTYWGWDVSGAANLDILHRRLIRCGMQRRKKWQVLSELPAKQRNVVPLPLSNPKEYEEAKKDFVGWLRKQSPQKAKRAEKAKALAQMGYLKRLAASLKLPAVLDWVDSFLDSTDEKLVLFAIHKTVVEALRERYQNSVVLDGSTAPKDRQAAVDRFQRDDKCRLFIGNVQAAGVGITLTAAKTVAFAEMGWTPAEMMQAEDRCHRIGQTEQVSVYYLVAKDTIEAKLCELLTKKSLILDKTLDGKKGKQAELDIHKELLKELSKEGK